MFIDKNIRVLIVDDSQTIRAIITKMLKKLDINNISDAYSGGQAFRIIKKSFTEANPIQLVISDWNMDGMNGIKLLKKIKEDPELSKVYFYMLSAEVDPRRMKEAMMAGADGFIKKPFTIENLKEKIQKVFICPIFDELAIDDE